MRNQAQWRARVLFLAPVGVLFLLFFVYPLGFVFVKSLTEWSGASAPRFIGPGNFVDIFSNPTFLTAVRNNIVWALSLGFVQIPLAALVAMILARRPRGWRMLRTMYFMPNVISQVAIAMLWLAIYNAEYGAINRLLEMAGLAGLSRNWLGDLHTALPAVILQQVLYIGYFMIIILASTLAIPDSLYEAAEIDGATVAQQELRITIPLLRPILVTTMTLAMAYGLRHFESTFLMTAGGPANTTMVMGIMLFNNMSFLQYGRANAIGVTLVILGVVVIVTLRRVFGRTESAAEARQ